MCVGPGEINICTGQPDGEPNIVRVPVQLRLPIVLPAPSNFR